jgi:hypothetical protein
MSRHAIKPAAMTQLEIYKADRAEPNVAKMLEEEFQYVLITLNKLQSLTNIQSRKSGYKQIHLLSQITHRVTHEDLETCTT